MSFFFDITRVPVGLVVMRHDSRYNVVRTPPPKKNGREDADFDAERRQPKHGSCSFTGPPSVLFAVSTLVAAC